MTDRTPTTANISMAYEDWMDFLNKPRPVARAEFDRWLAEHDREVENALRAAILRHVDPDDGTVDQHVVATVRVSADAAPPSRTDTGSES